LLPNGPDSGQLDLLSGTSSASECLPSTGPASRSGMTLPRLLPTPVTYDATPGGPNNHYKGLGHQAKHSELDFLQAGSRDRVNHTRLQESVRHLLTSVISGQSAPGSSASLDLDGACLKTCRDFYQARAAASSPASSVIWPRWGTALAGQLTALSMWERRTEGTECSSWPTPDARDANAEGLEAGIRRMSLYSTCGLQTAVKVKQIPTPRQEHDSGRHRGNPDTLHSYVKQWPTPTTRDWKDTMSGHAPPSRQKLSEQTPGQAVSATGRVGGALNPDWVTWLMNFPDGWLDLD
jgi:hypothetical protein